MEEAYEVLTGRGGQAQARDHPDRRHLRARRLRGDRAGDGRRPDHGLDRRHGRAAPTQDLLEEIARIGNGRYYVAEDPAQVPQIFAKETVTASKSAINEQPFMPAVVRPTQVLSEIALDEAPFLLGYVVTRPKPTAEVDPGHRGGRPAPGLVAVRPGDERGVHLRRQGPMGGRMAELAAVRPVLGAGRPPRAAQGRGEGHGRAGRAQGADRASSRSTRSSPPGKFLNRVDDRADPGRPPARDAEAGDGPVRPGPLPGRVRRRRSRARTS